MEPSERDHSEELILVRLAALSALSRLEGAKLCSLLRSCGRIARRSVARPDRRSRPHADHHLQLAPKIKELSRRQVIERALRHLDTSQTRFLIAERRLRRIQPHAWIDLGILVKRDQIGVRVARKSVRKKCVHAVGDGRNRSLALSRTLVWRALLTPARLRTSCCAHVYSSLSLAIQTLDSVSRHAAVSSVASKNL